MIENPTMGSCAEENIGAAVPRGATSTQ